MHLILFLLFAADGVYSIYTQRLDISFLFSLPILYNIKRLASFNFPQDFPIYPVGRAASKLERNNIYTVRPVTRLKASTTQDAQAVHF